MEARLDEILYKYAEDLTDVEHIKLRAAIVEAVLDMIGEDEKPVPAVPGTGRRSHAWDGYRALELFRNSLRAELRQAIKVTPMAEQEVKQSLSALDEFANDIRTASVLYDKGKITHSQYIDKVNRGKAAIVEAVEGIYGDSDGQSDTASTGSNQVVTLSELLAELRDSLEPTDDFEVGWFKDAWYVRVDLDTTIKQRPLMPTAYGRTGDSPTEAMQSMLAALRQDKVIDLVATDKEAI